MLLSAKAGDATHNHPLDKTCLKRRNRQIQDNLHLVQPIARHYAQQTGLESDDLLQVGCLGLIKAYNRYDAQRGAPFPSFAKPHIRGAILHFLRDRVGLIRLPRAVEERAMQMMRSARVAASSSTLAGEVLQGLYLALAEDLGLGHPSTDDCPRGAYNLLLTRQWMAMVRRSREGIRGFSVNALGFAVSLLST